MNRILGFQIDRYKFRAVAEMFQSLHGLTTQENETRKRPAVIVNRSVAQNWKRFKTPRNFPRSSVLPNISERKLKHSTEKSQI